MNEDIVIPIAGMIMVLLLPVVAAYTRRLWKTPTEVVPSNEELVRLERIEQAVDAIAVEVERISEAQRFTTKLLSDRDADPARALPPRREPGA